MKDVPKLPAAVDRHDDSPNFKRGGLSERLLQQLAAREVDAPHSDRHATPRRSLEREGRLRRELADAQAFLATGELMRPLPTHSQRMARIQAPDYVHSIRYQRQQWTCDHQRYCLDIPEEGGQRMAALERQWDVIAFEGRFVRQLKLNSIPAFTAEWSGRCLEVHHCYFLDRLDLGSWNIIATIGLDIAARMRLRVHWGGSVRNDRCAQWQIDDPDDPDYDYRADLDQLMRDKRNDRYRRD